jgi:hypothetical protein
MRAPVDLGEFGFPVDGRGAYMSAMINGGLMAIRSGPPSGLKASQSINSEGIRGKRLAYG